MAASRFLAAEHAARLHFTASLDDAFAHLLRPAPVLPLKWLDRAASAPRS